MRRKSQPQPRTGMRAYVEMCNNIRDSEKEQKQNVGSNLDEGKRKPAQRLSIIRSQKMLMFKLKT